MDSNPWKGAAPVRMVTVLLVTFLLFLGLFVFFFQWGAQQELPVVGAPPAMPTEVSLPEPPGVRIREVVQGLEDVAALESAPNETLFVGERSGRIEWVPGAGNEEAETLVTLEEVVPVDGGGLMGLAFMDPDDASDGALYALHTALAPGERDGTAPDSEEARLESRVVRVPLEGDDAGEPETVRGGLPAGTRKNGGGLAFGPDGFLYASIGDVGTPSRAQDPADPAGAILRMTPSGEAPSDNPWVEAGSGGDQGLVWATGFRDVRGLAWHPHGDSLFAVDRGPREEWQGIGPLDEVNVVEPGGNYGWPEVVGAPGVEGFRDPWLTWVARVDPGGLAFLGDADLVLTSEATGAVIRVELGREGNGYVARAVERWFVDEAGAPRLRNPGAPAEARDEAIYMAVAESEGGPRTRVVRVEWE